MRLILAQINQLVKYYSYDEYIGNVLRNGKGKLNFNCNEYYDGDWRDDVREGKGVYKYENGDKFEGEWKNNQINGNGKYFYKNWDIYDGNWENSEMEGNGRMERRERRENER